jgi:polysaccharide chain length determinant protein (PEP-CTERM system associated)
VGEIRGLIDQGFAIARRRRWLAVAVFLITLVAGLSATRALPTVYQSSALVAIEDQTVPEEFVKNPVVSPIENRLQRISQELLNQTRLEALVQQLSLYPELRDLATTAQLARRLRGEIELELTRAQPIVRGTPLIVLKISHRGNRPKTVAAVVNTLAESYVSENTRLRERYAFGTAEFLKSQVQEVAAKLDEQEQRVSAFKRRYLGELPEQMQANITTLEHLNNQLRVNTDAQLRARDRIEQRAQTASLASSLRAISGDPQAPVGETVAARVSRLKQELIELRLRFSDKYPDVLQKQAEIATLERLLKSGAAGTSGDTSGPGATDSGNVATSREDEELKILQEEEKRLRAAIATYQARLENAPKREQEFLEVSRNYETTKEHYASLLKRLEEAQIAGNLEHRQKGEQFRLLEAASPDRSTVAPQRRALMAAVLAAALILAAIAAFVRDQLDTSFHTADDVRQATSVPVLAAIPEIVGDGDIRRRRLRFALGTVLTAMLLVAFAGLARHAAMGNEKLVLALMRFGI